MEAIGAIIGQGSVSIEHQTGRGDRASRRTGQPIRRQSYLRGREGHFWRPTTRREVQQIILAAERFDRANKRAGAKNGPLGGVAIEVLRYLANCVDYRSGRLEPSLDTMQAKLARSRDAIHRALKALRAHGFLDWLRRYVPTDSETGPQVKQTSNAYRLSLPARAKALLGRLWGSAPPPDDFAHARACKAAEMDAHQASLTPEQLPGFLVDDDELANVLAKLGRAVMDRKQREYGERTESPASF